MTTVIAPAPSVSNNLQATPEDAKTLGRIFVRLYNAVKNMREAVKGVSQAWTKGEAALNEAIDYRNQMQAKVDVIFTECWAGLKALPKGTVAPGKATPQTVALQFFNANINRDLTARITAADAKRINSRSFGV